jgi:hypothetical protein
MEQDIVKSFASISDIYMNFRRAWVRRVVHGPQFASGLANARSTMQADPAYDSEKYRTALFAAEADAEIAANNE